MKLRQLLESVETETQFNPETEIVDIAYDSRKAGENIMFVCLKGASRDGHAYAKSAYENGSRVFLVQSNVELPTDASVIVVSDTRAALAAVSAVFFGYPSKRLSVIGVTGTKGKTTTTHLIKSILDKNGLKCGIIGTVGARWGTEERKTVNTTPESYETQKLLCEMADGGCKAVAIEVSSLGLKSHRVDCVDFEIGVFMNISIDHIGGNEHESFEEYFYWKKQLFSKCKMSIGFADDEAAEEMLEESAGKKLLFGLNGKSNFRAENIFPLRSNDCLGVRFDCFSADGMHRKIELGLPGDYNVFNALAAIAVCRSLGVDIEQQREALKTTKIRGRTEPMIINNDYAVFIDYAHNGVSLKNLLLTMREYSPKRLVCLFGCVGDRAFVRREEMGLVAGSLCDFCIVTSDDPNFEDPDKIIGEVTKHIEKVGGEYAAFADRAEAINFAAEILREGDLMIFAGKGHEEHQLINGIKQPFNEKEIFLKAMKKRGVALV